MCGKDPYTGVGVKNARQEIVTARLTLLLEISKGSLSDKDYCSRWSVYFYQLSLTL